MKNLTEYFQEREIAYRFKHGDRVFGYYNEIPVMGTVKWEHLLNAELGPEVLVELDLPIKIDNEYRSYVRLHKCEKVVNLA